MAAILSRPQCVNHDDMEMDDEMDDEMETFPHYWPYVRGIHGHCWIPCTKASDAEHWCFFYLHLNKRLS